MNALTFAMGALRPGAVSSRDEIETRLQKLDLDIECQKRIVCELERDQRPAVGANTLLRLLEEARRVLMEELSRQQ